MTYEEFKSLMEDKLPELELEETNAGIMITSSDGYNHLKITFTPKFIDGIQLDNASANVAFIKHMFGVS